MVLVDNQWTLYDKAEQRLMNYRFDEIEYTENHRKYQYIVKINGKFGLTDEYGKELLPAKYDSIKWLNETNYTLYKKGKGKPFSIE